ncbi:MAG: BON domain-containing protein [Pseudomonadota bacterium]|nr:BON domain-containing protein [Pseudomonadota bacterium]
MKKHFLKVVLATSVFSLAAANALSQSSPPGAVPADNAKSNKLDPTNTAASADTQKDNSSDRTVTQRIRQKVMADKSLSTYAHNVKIVSVNGTVTLNGVVRSEQEKSTIAAQAASVAGENHVVNELKVTPKT